MALRGLHPRQGEAVSYGSYIGYVISVTLHRLRYLGYAGYVRYAILAQAKLKAAAWEKDGLEAAAPPVPPPPKALYRIPSFGNRGGKAVKGGRGAADETSDNIIEDAKAKVAAWAGGGAQAAPVAQPQPQPGDFLSTLRRTLSWAGPLKKLNNNNNNPLNCVGRS